VSEDQSKEASGISVFLLEELGDARLRCGQLKKFIDEAVTLVEDSAQRDHFFEVAGHLIYGIPEVMMKMEKALHAAAMAAAKWDYEEIKDDLRPEKADQLEAALAEVRARRVTRYENGKDGSQETPMKVNEAADRLERIATAIDETGKLDTLSLKGLIAGLEGPAVKIASNGVVVADVLRGLSKSLLSSGKKKPSRLMLATALRRVLADALEVKDEDKVGGDFPPNPGFGEEDKVTTAEEAKRSRFEEGKPADPTKQMSPEDAQQWDQNTEEHKDEFKAASWKKHSKFEEGKPADPTKEMSPDDAEEWDKNTEEHKDEFKTAKEFPSSKALSEYLSKHPNADARDHKVVRPQDKDTDLADLKSRAKHNRAKDMVPKMQDKKYAWKLSLIHI
jgi:hypothetical protein